MCRWWCSSPSTAFAQKFKDELRRPPSKGPRAQCRPPVRLSQRAGRDETARREAGVDIPHRPASESLLVNVSGG